MLSIPAWLPLHRAAVAKIRSKRTEKGKRSAVRLTITSIHTDPADPAALGDAWRLFVAKLGSRNARLFWPLVMAHLSNTGHADGVIRATREAFGARVLSTDEDPVSTREGQAVYDALIASGLGLKVGSVEADPAPRTGTPDGEAGPGGRTGTPDRESVPGPGSGAVPGPDPVPPGVRSEERTTPPLPSPTSGEGGGKVAAPLNGAASGPLTPGELAVAAVIATALEEVKLRCETAEEAAEVARCRQHALSGHPDDRPKAAAALRKLLNAEVERRKSIIRALRNPELPGPVSWRLLIDRFQHLEPVRLACLAARKAARADDRDRRRVAREAPHVPAATIVETSAPVSDTSATSSECPEIVPPSLESPPDALVAEARKHVRLKGLVQSGDLAAVLRDLHALAGGRGWQTSSARALRDVAVPRRDTVWLDQVRAVLVRAAAGPPAAWLAQEETSRVSAALRWLSTDLERPELAQRAAAHLANAGTPDAPAEDWRERAEELLREASAAPAAAGSVA